VVSIGNIPFGQGLSVSVIQLARAYAVLANGGKLVTPHLLFRSSGQTTEPVWPVRQAIREETAKQTTAMLKAVVSEGTGAAAAVTGYEVAGKTGTAQKTKPGVVGYAEGVYISSFAGFLPADDPRVLVVVTLDEPSRAYYGGTVAAPAFSKVAQFAVTHLKVPPTTVSTNGTASGNGVAAAPVDGRGAAKPVLDSTSPGR
jgi:cell division protein FtsI/penicillin-binding protein 2